MTGRTVLIILAAALLPYAGVALYGVMIGLLDPAHALAMLTAYCKGTPENFAERLLLLNQYCGGFTVTALLLGIGLNAMSKSEMPAAPKRAARITPTIEAESVNELQ